MKIKTLCSLVSLEEESDISGNVEESKKRLALKTTINPPFLVAIIRITCKQPRRSRSDTSYCYQALKTAISVYTLL